MVSEIGACTTLAIPQKLHSTSKVLTYCHDKSSQKVLCGDSCFIVLSVSDEEKKF